MTPFDFDIRAWVVWVLAAAAVTMAARNPLYSILLLATSLVVERYYGKADGAFQLRLTGRQLLRLGLLVVLFSGAFMALFVHAGDVVLFTIPESVPLAGGIITLEAFLNGAANGLLLLTVLSFFLTFNRVVSADRLARLAPHAFQDLGIVVLVALTYVPETTRHVQRIREAQAVRGRRIRGVRDWQPLLIPLLVGGLERAMALAEAMVARGFGATRRAPASPALVGTLALAMGLTFGGWVLALWWGWPGWLLVGLGVLGMAVIVWSAGRAAPITRYRQRPWQAQDTVLAGASIFPVVALLLPWAVVGRESLTVNFLSGLDWPLFDPVAGGLLLLFATPVFAALISAPAAVGDENDHD